MDSQKIVDTFLANQTKYKCISILSSSQGLSKGLFPYSVFSLHFVDWCFVPPCAMRVSPMVISLSPTVRCHTNKDPCLRHQPVRNIFSSSSVSKDANSSHNDEFLFLNFSFILTLPMFSPCFSPHCSQVCLNIV